MRLVFSIPDKGIKHLFPQVPSHSLPKHLAYIEWFTPFTTPHPDHGLYAVSRGVTRQGVRRAGIIPVDDLERSCHLYPDFGPVAPRAWTSSSVLEDCKHFFVNALSDKYMYKLVY